MPGGSAVGGMARTPKPLVSLRPDVSLASSVVVVSRRPLYPPEGRMPSEREYEQALQREPGHNEAFLSLRRSYRESGRFDKLVSLYETRAQAIQDQAKAAELFYLAAEVRVDHLSDVSGAEADLAHAVNRDATHRKAVKRLKNIYREQGRSGEYLNMLEVEAAAVGHAK